MHPSAVWVVTTGGTMPHSGRLDMTALPFGGRRMDHAPRGAPHVR
jgi:hypothetical protein